MRRHDACRKGFDPGQAHALPAGRDESLRNRMQKLRGGSRRPSNRVPRRPYDVVTCKGRVTVWVMVVLAEAPV